MKTISYYLSKEYFKSLVLCQFIFVFLYLTIDFTQKIGRFVEAGASTSMITIFFLYKIPLIATQIAPAASLISVVILFSFMKKNNEITALKASGINVVRLSLPVLYASLCVSIAVFLFSELFVPFASEKSNDIWYGDIKKKRSQKRFYNRSDIWYRSDQAIYGIKHFDGKLMIMQKPTFYFFDDSFHLIKRIDAQKTTWTGNGWRAEEGIILTIGKDGPFKTERFKEMEITIPEKPDAFLKTEKRPEEMSYWELKRHAEKTARGGYNDTKIIVDQNRKLALPLLSFIMALIGIPLALLLKKGGTSLVVFLGISGCFVYLIILGFTQSLGYAGIIPPILSAWFANFIFLFLGAYLMMKVET